MAAEPVNNNTQSKEVTVTASNVLRDAYEEKDTTMHPYCFRKQFSHNDAHQTEPLNLLISSSLAYKLSLGWIEQSWRNQAQTVKIPFIWVSILKFHSIGVRFSPYIYILLSQQLSIRRILKRGRFASYGSVGCRQPGACDVKCCHSYTPKEVRLPDKSRCALIERAMNG